MCPCVPPGRSAKVEASVKIDELLGHIETVLRSLHRGQGSQAFVEEFLQTYTGQNSSFLKSARKSHDWSHQNANRVTNLTSVLEAFRAYVHQGLHAQLSPALPVLATGAFACPPGRARSSACH